MTTIRATIVADSISPEGIRLTTFQLKYPYIIHGELMTHRVMSRNASSTRAIPIKELIRRIKEDPFVPLHWGAAQKGMQADKECNSSVRAPADSFGMGKLFTNEEAWIQAMSYALAYAEAFDKAGYHKQVANRLLMPFMHMDTVCTATDYANFFHLRIHPEAEPHICMLAKTMKQQLDLSKPRLVQPGDWHLPYITYEDRVKFAHGGETVLTIENEFLIKQSVARCAWVSYVDPLGKKATVEQEIALHDKLVVSQPLHATPAEHQATPDSLVPTGLLGPDNRAWLNEHQWGNLRGWRQYRKMLPGEYVHG
jgi:thymidylate synthase ThyX